MQKLAANLTEKMLRRKLISPEQAEWCAYLVECKLEQMLCFSVLIALGCLIAPLWEVLLLNWGVVFLRRKANGLHLHTFAGCMLSSLFCELTALWACEKVTPAVAVLLLTISLLTLCLAAPVNDVNIHFDSDEMQALRGGMQKRLAVYAAVSGTVFFACPQVFGILSASACIIALCVLLADPLLRLLQVPAAILPIAVNYLRIVFAGLIFTFFYNFLAATMRALGDSKSALYFLMISAVLNIGGDLFFVEALGWGSEGCALSTVLSEAACCLLCVVYIRYKVPVLQLGRRWLVYDGKLLRKTVSYGWASAMQQATVQLGKIAVQAIVNTMGVNAMAAFTAASRIDDFAYTPQQNIGHAMTTLMAQNRGAGKTDRVRQGYHCGMRIEFVYALLLTGVCLLFAEPIIRLFAADPAVVDLGVRFLRTISLFYLMPAATNGIQGFFRGMGDLKVTLNSSMLNMGGRVAAAALFVLVLKMDIEALPFSYAVGWLLMLLYELPMLVRFLRSSEM